MSTTGISYEIRPGGRAYTVTPFPAAERETVTREAGKLIEGTEREYYAGQTAADTRCCPDERM